MRGTHGMLPGAREIDIVAVDVGGTHARFAPARIAGGAAPALGPVLTYKTSDHAGLVEAWAAFRRDSGIDRPFGAAIAVAGPIGGDKVRFTNNPWVLDPGTLAADLGLDRLTLLNDFGAMAHATRWIADRDCRPLAGPQTASSTGVTTIIGPGTGLGVAMFAMRGGRGIVIESEGGHIAFAPLDPIEATIAARLRDRFGRVSVERLVSGPGLANIHAALADADPVDDKLLWASAIAGDDPLAVQALDRFVLCFGAVAGDLALAQGSDSVMIVGGLANRIADRLADPAFVDRFVAKGRHEGRMRTISVRLCTHAQPGLLGAAAAFQAEHVE